MMRSEKQKTQLCAEQLNTIRTEHQRIGVLMSMNGKSLVALRF